jgi:hypothetical protein
MLNLLVIRRILIDCLFLCFLLNRLFLCFFLFALLVGLSPVVANFQGRLSWKALRKGVSQAN